ncbi:MULTISPECIES: cell division protein FtsL [unclassified Enterococcus]|jgi:cell division protein FtsL|uniref:cell division protein FtsL n=1 Tax=unclassified Enterococcus TaxID=2608891 RepID=UPI000352DDCD|nr:cell division protein FtsL [Enterococcus faecalis 13-SD-W-01]
MAELNKLQEYPYDLPEMVEQPDYYPLPDSTPEREIELPQSPAKHLRKVSNLEKLSIAGMIFAVIALSIFTIMLRTNISGLENDITSIQSETTIKKQEKNSLEQEKSELSRTERIKQIAEEKGLSINDDNLRKVK